MEKQHRTSSIGAGIAYGFLLLPFVIFVIGWMKIYLAVPIVMISLVGFWLACKDAPKLWLPEMDRDNIVKVIVIIGILGLWIFYSGMGKTVFQNEDLVTRNAILNTLISDSWPVVNTNIVQNISSIGNPFSDTAQTGMTYYIGFWLPSALIGKLLGVRVGYYAMMLWALLGLALMYYLLCAHLKKLVIWPLAIVIFFSGLDYVGYFLTNADFSSMANTLHLEWWGTPYQYSSMTTQLFWVFNQAIPAWLCTMLILVHKNNRSIVFLIACTLISSTFPFVGLGLLALFYILGRRFKDTFTIQNVLGGGVIGITSAMYLLGNMATASGENLYGGMYDNNLAKYILFLLLDVGAYAVLIYRYNKENKLYYFVLFCLCIIPPIKVGYGVDFCMRASIPVLFILMVLVIDALEKAKTEKHHVNFAALLFVLLIGANTPIHEMTRTFTETFTRINNEEMVYAEDMEHDQLLSLENFVCDTGKSFFYRYMAKH